MTTAVQDQIREFTTREYEYGFVTEIEADSIPPGLNALQREEARDA